MKRAALLASALVLGGCDLSLTGFDYLCNATNPCPSSTGGTTGSVGTAATSGTTGTGSSTSGVASGTSSGVAASGTSSGAAAAGTTSGTTSGITVTLLAGRGKNFAGLVDGAALGTAEFDLPQGLAYQYPLLYVADTVNEAIRVVNLDAGIVSTLNGSAIGTLAVDALAFENGSVLLAAGVGLDAVTVSSGSTTPFVPDDGGFARGMAYDPVQQLVYLSDEGRNCIETIDLTLANPAVVPFAGSCGAPKDLKDGSLTSARFNGPCGLALDDAGTLYVADSSNFVIRAIQGGMVSTIAGNPNVFLNSQEPMWVDGEGQSAGFVVPLGLTIDSRGNLFVGDEEEVREVIAQSDGGRYVTTVVPYSVSNDPIDQAAALTIDEDGGNLFVADAVNDQLFVIHGF